MTSVTFEAAWTSRNSHLESSVSNIFQSEHLSVIKKTYLIFCRTLESLMQCLCPERVRAIAQSVIVPASVDPDAAQSTRQQWNQNWNSANPLYGQLRNIYDPVSLQVTAPDNTVLEGVFYRNRASRDQDIPTILCFNGNGGHPHTQYWNSLLAQCAVADRPFNVIVCNYASPNLECARDLVQYGDAFYQAAVAEGISEHNIHFVGVSLGGAVAALVAKLHPDAGRLVNINSFDSLEHFIMDQEMILRNSRFTKWIISKLVAAIGWAVEPGRALNALKQKTLFVYTQADEIISSRISAVHAVGGPNFASNRVIRMQPRQGALDGHNAPLSNYNDARGVPVLRRIVDFLSEEV